MSSPARTMGYVIASARISKHAVAGVLPAVRAYEPRRRSPEDERWDLLRSFAMSRIGSGIPSFDSELTREARAADERRWKAAARAYAMGAYDWARLAEPTVDRFAKHARTIVELFIEQFTTLFRRNSTASLRPAQALPDTPGDLLVRTLTSAPCAPPTRALHLLLEGPIAA